MGPDPVVSEWVEVWQMVVESWDSGRQCLRTTQVCCGGLPVLLLVGSRGRCQSGVESWYPTIVIISVCGKGLSREVAKVFAT